MKLVFSGAALALATVALAACSGSNQGFTPAGQSLGTTANAPAGPNPSPQSICRVGGNTWYCPTPFPSVPPNAQLNHWGPADLQAAYGVAGYTGALTGKTVAIIAGSGYPTLERDLDIYREAYKIPTCTMHTGCLTEVDQDGLQNLPPANTPYAHETAIDVDMVSAMCPTCKILVIETDMLPVSNETQALAWLAQVKKALNTAVTLGASVASISYTIPGSEFQNDLASIQPYQSFFAALPIPVVASAGDAGYNQQDATTAYAYGNPLPADFPTVVSVGGTSLQGINPHNEVVWQHGGSGCSLLFAAPSFQAGLANCSGKREIPDISFDADPAYGVEIYFTDPASGSIYTGTFQTGSGTSVGAPAIAAMAAMAGATNAMNQTMYSNLANFGYGDGWGVIEFWDITSGTNSSSGCAMQPLACTAFAGFDGSTGIGTPNDVGNFK